MTPSAKCPLLPHLPLPLLILGTTVWAGYRSCDDDLFAVLLIGPLVLLILSIPSIVLVTLRTPQDWRARIAVLHLVILLLAVSLTPGTVALGKWIWERRVLAPRSVALRTFSPRTFPQPHTPMSIEGYAFAACEQAPQGTLFYTLELGGPFASKGVFVPGAAGGQDIPGNIRSIAPTSIPGIFWFVTKD